MGSNVRYFSSGNTLFLAPTSRVLRWHRMLGIFGKLCRTYFGEGVEAVQEQSGVSGCVGFMGWTCLHWARAESGSAQSLTPHKIPCRQSDLKR